jgi:hypothetical protein
MIPYDVPSSHGGGTEFKPHSMQIVIREYVTLSNNTLIGTSWVVVKLIGLLMLWGGLLAYPDSFMNLMNYEFVTLH